MNHRQPMIHAVYERHREEVPLSVLDEEGPFKTLSIPGVYVVVECVPRQIEAAIQFLDEAVMDVKRQLAAVGYPPPVWRKGDRVKYTHSGTGETVRGVVEYDAWAGELVHVRSGETDYATISADHLERDNVIIDAPDVQDEVR